MDSTLKNMVLTLLVITLISALSVGLVYNGTLNQITKAENDKVNAALAKVLPKGEITNSPSQEKKSIEIDNLMINVYTAKSGDNVLGYAVESITKKGYSGEFKIMVGFNANCDIENIEVLQHKETPGLGGVMTEPNNVLLVSFQGKNPADLKMKVKKDGGDIDAITASTITSKAYTDAVERAYKAVLSVKKGGSSNE